MPRIYIDNQTYDVPEGNLLAACLALGFDLPYFCWHPGLHSVGACRQCAVKLFKDEHDTRGRVVMSCMTPVAEGMRISIDDPEASAFRKSIIELLMLNHPHDCPVCDEGGECHLQDMTVMAGHDYRRTRFPKRTHVNQDLGPYVTHEMNRCIQCYRCVRFYRDYAGGRDLEVLGWHGHVYFGRQASGPLESEFAGNLVEVCPTGVFTDKSLAEHYTRKWDLQTAPSVCVGCGVGCNTVPGERYGSVRRIRSRYNGEVNGFFLCDRGRYGYEFVNADTRITGIRPYGRPQGRDSGERDSAFGIRVSGEETGKLVLSPNPETRIPNPETRLIGIGSPRASLESNFALRELVGAERFHSGMSAGEHKLMARIVELLRAGPAKSASLERIRQAEAVLVLGEDLSKVAPMMDLAVRQASRQKPMREAMARLKLPRWDDAALRYAIGDARGPVFIATPEATRLDALATRTFRGDAQQIIEFARGIADQLAGAQRDADKMSARHEGETPSSPQTVARELAGVDNPVIICGPSMQSAELLEAAHAVAFVAPECNSVGLAMMDAGAIEAVLPALKAGLADTLVVLENDLYERLPREQADELFAAAKRVIVLDHSRTPTTERAQAVLPAATFAEGSGTYVNYEGRAQRFFRVFNPPAPIQESWRWLYDMRAKPQAAAGAPENVTLDDMLDAMAQALPALAGARDAAPHADFRIDGDRVPRQPHRYSGRTAMTADVAVHEPTTPRDPDGPLSFSMEGTSRLPPPALTQCPWAPGWNSNQAINKFQQELGPGLDNYVSGTRLIEPSTNNQAPNSK